MTPKRDDDSSPLNKVMDFIKGSGKSGSNHADPGRKKVNFSIWYFVAAMLMFVWFQSYMGQQQTEKIPYSDFKQWARDGKVGNLVVGPEQITGNVKGEEGKPARSFVTVRIEDPELVGQLEQKRDQVQRLF